MNSLAHLLFGNLQGALIFAHFEQLHHSPFIRSKSAYLPNKLTHKLCFLAKFLQAKHMRSDMIIKVLVNFNLVMVLSPVPFLHNSYPHCGTWRAHDQVSHTSTIECFSNAPTSRSSIEGISRTSLTVNFLYDS